MSGHGYGRPQLLEKAGLAVCEALRFGLAALAPATATQRFTYP